MPPITLPVSIPSTATDALQPVDEFLLKGFDTNQKYIASKITEGGTGSGGAGGIINITASQYLKNIDQIASGGETNEAITWRKRFHFGDWVNPDATTAEAIDLKSDDLNKTKQWWGDYTSTFSQATAPASFKGVFYWLPKSKSISMRVKKGANFFQLAQGIDGNRCDRYDVLVDGVLPSSLGLLNENFGPASDFVTPIVSGTYAAFNRPTLTLLNLDPTKEHIIKITNNDSASRDISLSYFEFGFMSMDYTTTNKIKLSNGITEGGIEFDGGEFQFNNNTYSGHQGALAVSTAGVVRALDGIPSATTALRDFKPINFPSYPTTIFTRGIYNFPSSGIASITTDLGDTFVFSYSGKDESSPQNTSFTGVLWQSIADRQMQSGLNPLYSTKPTNNDFIINLIGTAPIEITNTNNKIDFSITLNGITTTHTATIPNGRYSADYVPFEKAFNESMQTQKKINGLYYADYDSDLKLWTFGANGEFVEEIKFLFSSGPSSSSSIASTFGFSTDLIGKTFYRSEVAKNHSCCRGFEYGPLFDYASPKMRFAWSGGSVSTNANLAKIYNFTGWSPSVNISPGSGGYTGNFFILLDENAIGIELTFEWAISSGIIVNIDNKLNYHLSLCGQVGSTGYTSSIYTYFFTFPKGSRLLNIHSLAVQYVNYAVGTQPTQIKFQFARELFSRPAIEELNVGEKIIKLFEVAPFQLWENGTTPSNTGTTYVAQGGIDKLKSVLESGSWNGSAESASFSKVRRFTNTQNSYIDFEFELTKNGGGFSLWLLKYYDVGGSSGTFATFHVYLTTTGIINESTDLFATNTVFSGHGSGSKYLNMPVSYVGLKAGTYKVRFKKTDTTAADQTFHTIQFSILDLPQEKFVTKVSDVSLTNKTIPVPLNYIPSINFIDDEKISSSSEWRLINSNSIYSRDYNLINQFTYTITSFFNGKFMTSYYPFSTYSETQSARFSSDYPLGGQIFSFCYGDEIFLPMGNISTFTNSVTASLNGIAIATENPAFQNKSGLNSVTTNNFCYPVIRLPLENPCAFSTGNTFTASLTGYLKIGGQVLLFDNLGNSEQLKITAIATNASFDVTPRKIITDANVTYYKASGFQALKAFSNQAGTSWEIPFVGVTPLPITKSKFIETFITLNAETAYSDFNNLAAGANALSFPVFKDGSRGDSSNTTAVVTMLQNASTFYSISLGSQITISITGGTASVRLISIKGKRNER